MKNRLLSLLISVLIFTCHVHFRPIGTSLFVLARFIVFNSLPALLLGMILDFAVEAVLSVPVSVFPVSGVVSSPALPGSLKLVSVLVLEAVVSLVLKRSDVIFWLVFIVILGLAVVLDDRNWF